MKLQYETRWINGCMHDVMVVDHYGRGVDTSPSIWTVDTITNVPPIFERL